MAAQTVDRFLIPAREFEPAYLALYRSGELQRRAQQAIDQLAACRLCPRSCGVDRLSDRKAACKTGRYAVTSSYFAHRGEEDCLRGWNGSGTIFFAWCNLRCVFCFHPDTFISTDQGLMRIADIFELDCGEQALNGGKVRFGDGSVRVVTREGELATVTKMFCHPFTGELIKIKPFNCPPLRLTPNHRVYAVSKDAPDQVVKVQAAELTTDHYLLVPKRVPISVKTTVDVAALLSYQDTTFRKTPFRIPAEQLTTLFAQPLTSFELAEATGYHPAYIRKLRGQWKRGGLRTATDVIEVNELVKEDGLIRFQTEKRPGIPAWLTLDERLAWLLGIYCAEGHVTSLKNRPNSHRLIFSFGYHEVHLVEQVKRLLEELSQVSVTICHRRTTITVESGKASLALLFAHLCGHGAHDKRVPGLILTSSPAVIQAYLDGALEGDGCDRGTHLVINTVSETFAHGLFEIGLSLGILPSLYCWRPPARKTIEEREVNQSPLYYVKFPKVNPLTGKRHSRWREAEGWYLMPIHKIERIPYDGPVFNLEVDDADHSYLASFVAVSNCQNYDISQLGEGATTSPQHLAAMMLRLQVAGCHNINFVTPEHVVPQVLEALVIAVERGLRLPIVYNTSAYDSAASLCLLDGVIDIYMPDFKFWDPQLALKYLKAKDYPEAARHAITEMHRQAGALKFDENGIALRGVLVRHLVMPGCLDDTKAILRFLAQEVSPDTYVNIMAQYYPSNKVSFDKYPELNRRITLDEYHAAIEYAQQIGLQRLDERHRLRRAW